MISAPIPRKWSELITGCCLVAASQDHAARRRASSISGITVGENDALGYKSVDIRGLDIRLRCAAECRDIIVANVVQNDHHNVWSITVRRVAGPVSGNLPVRRNGVFA